MANMINGINVPFVPIVKPEHPVNKVQEGSSTFDSIFKTEFEKLKFSNHATKRLESRELELSTTDMDKLQNAVMRAEAKGSKDSLVMMNNRAFIVNIPNKTVITALDINKSSENIFTNIDSVVFAT
ncbi:MAG: flagellar protein [Ignavibacteriales bacterium]|nr:flagellar protein [Ignavibacteriales bacterium]